MKIMGIDDNCARAYRTRAVDTGVAATGSAALCRVVLITVRWYLGATGIDNSVIGAVVMIILKRRSRTALASGPVRQAKGRGCGHSRHHPPRPFER